MQTQPLRRFAVPAAVGVVLAAMIVTTTPVNAQDGGAPQAAETDQATSEARGIHVRAGISSIHADKLADELGPKRTAGVYFDQKTERMVVTVADDQSAQAVAAAGGVAKRVKHSTEVLEAARKALDDRIDTPGTAWGTDVIANQINATADSTVSDADFAEMSAVLAPFGDAARLTRIGGKQGLDSTVNGGKYIVALDGTTCSAGFNVRKKSNNSSLYLLTAGHCTVHANGVNDWSNGAGDYFGYDAGGRFPGTDYGLIKHNNASVSKPGNVYWHGSGNVTDITHSRDPGVGEPVCMSGYRSGVQCGTVWELDTKRVGDDGTVTGLFRTDICTNPGDSGGPIFHNDAALGIHSGSPRGSTDCIAYHQPVNPALAWYGVEVY